ncbi:MAG: helix-turn-helix domain-containing protein [Thermoplasmatota archaeon]
MYEAILDVNLERCWIGKTLKKYPVSIKIMDTIPFRENGVQDLVEVDPSGTDLEELTEFIDSIPEVEYIKVHEQSHKKRVKMIVSVKKCIGCRALVDSETFLLSRRSLDQSWAQWRVLLTQEKFIEQLSQNLDELGMEHRIIDMYEFRDWDNLASKEELVLKEALQGGYYDFPKRIGIREIAKKLNVSTAYISYTLRSGQKKAIQKYFGIKDR